MSYEFDSKLLTDWPSNTETDNDSQAFVLVVGSAASGLDLATETTQRLYQDESGTANYYPLNSEALLQKLLSPQNQRALALLEAWYSEPDDLGADWWAEFEQELRQHRLTFRIF